MMQNNAVSYSVNPLYDGEDMEMGNMSAGRESSNVRVAGAPTVLKFDLEQQKDMEERRKLVQEDCDKWVKEFYDKLFVDGHLEVSFGDLYRLITVTYGIMMTRTEVWNDFLSPDIYARSMVISKSKEKSIRCTSLLTRPLMEDEYDKFTRAEIRKDKVVNLYFKCLSARQAKRIKTVHGVTEWKEIFSGRVLQLARAFFYFQIVMFSAFSIAGRINDPVGDIYNEDHGAFSLWSWICCWGILIFLLFSNCSPRWFNPTWCSIACNVFILIFSLVMSIQCFTVFDLQKYKDADCFQCPECSSTDGSICWEVKTFPQYFNGGKKYYTDTCSCAVKDHLRGDFVLGSQAEFCNADLENCNDCQGVLNVHRRHCGTIGARDCDPKLGDYDCMYYDLGHSWFFRTGWAIASLFLLEAICGAIQLVDAFLCERALWKGCKFCGKSCDDNSIFDPLMA